MPSFALTFPGQGSQFVGMAKDLYDQFSEVRFRFEEASDLLKIGFRKLCFEASLSDLTATEVLQPSLFLVETSFWTVFHSLLQDGSQRSSEVRPLVTLGHSLGEWPACYVAGLVDFADGLYLTAQRGLSMAEASSGGMTAFLGLGFHEVNAACEALRSEGSLVWVANENAPEQIVAAGETQALSLLESSLKALPGIRKFRAMKLNVSAPFHCPLMKPAQNRFSKLLEQTRFQVGSIPVVHNATSQETHSVNEALEWLGEQITAPVRWSQCLQTVQKKHTPDFYLELGPGSVLTGLLKKNLPEAHGVSLSSFEQMRRFVDQEEWKSLSNSSQYKNLE